MNKWLIVLAVTVQLEYVYHYYLNVGQVMFGLFWN